MRVKTEVTPEPAYKFFFETETHFNTGGKYSSKNALQAHVEKQHKVSEDLTLNSKMNEAELASMKGLI